MGFRATDLREKRSRQQEPAQLLEGSAVLCHSGRSDPAVEQAGEESATCSRVVDVTAVDMPCSTRKVWRARALR